MEGGWPWGIRERGDKGSASGCADGENWVWKLWPWLGAQDFGALRTAVCAQGVGDSHARAPEHGLRDDHSPGRTPRSDHPELSPRVSRPVLVTHALLVPGGGEDARGAGKNLWPVRASHQ